MSNSANARPRKSSGIACCMIVSAEIFPRKNEKNPMKSMAGEAGHATRAPPKTRVPAPSRNIDASSRRIGGIRSFHFCARTKPSAPPTRPPAARDRERRRCWRRPLHEVLRVEREREQPEPPELVAEHLERREPERGRRAAGDLLQARHHVAHHLRGLARRSSCRARRPPRAACVGPIKAHDHEDAGAGDHDGPGRERHAAPRARTRCPPPGRAPRPPATDRCPAAGPCPRGRRGSRRTSRRGPRARALGRQQRRRSARRWPGRCPRTSPCRAGSMNAPATTATTAATITLVQLTTLRRWNRSMNTPMNGEISVYGHVQRQHDLQEVVGRRHRRDVEPLLAAERDRLADRALDHALARPAPGTARPSASRSRGSRRRANSLLKKPPKLSSTPRSGRRA